MLLSEKGICTSLLVVLSACALLLVGDTRGQSGRQTRVVELSPVADFQFGTFLPVPTRATVVIHNYNDLFASFYNLSVTGLRQERFSGDAYCIYFTTRANPEDGGFSQVRFTFNTDFDGRISLQAPTPFDIPFDSPTITVLIALEPDDGRRFDPTQDLGKIAFVGTSTW